VIRLAYFQLHCPPPAGLRPRGHPDGEPPQQPAVRQSPACSIHHKGDYLQILEGPTEPVLRVFAAIAKDPRHTGVTEIFSRTHQQA